MELKISSIENFNSLSCLITNILHITLIVTWLHHITLHGWHCKRSSAWKKSYGTFPYLHRHLTKSLWLFQWLLSANINVHLRVDAFHVISYLADNCAFCVEHSSRVEPNGNRQKTMTKECPFLKRGSVAVYLRSLRIGATEEKYIPRPSRELMNCK